MAAVQDNAQTATLDPEEPLEDGNPQDADTPDAPGVDGDAVSTDGDVDFMDDTALINIVNQQGGDPTDPVQMKLAKRLRDQESYHGKLHEQNRRIIGKLSGDGDGSGEKTKKPKHVAEVVQNAKPDGDGQAADEPLDPFDPESVRRFQHRTEERALERARAEMLQIREYDKQEQEIYTDPELQPFIQDGTYGEYLEAIRTGQGTRLKDGFAAFLHATGKLRGVGQRPQQQAPQGGGIRSVDRRTASSISQGQNAPSVRKPKYGEETTRYMAMTGQLPDPNVIPHHL